jgi:toxin-antitoxin system PIN domain toxin
MQTPDVNVLVSAFRTDAPHHRLCRDWLERVLATGEMLAISELVLSGVLRVLTHPKVFAPPTPLGEALTYTRVLQSHPRVVPLRAGPGHWRIFAQLCERSHATGNRIPDAFHAALAIEHGCEWVTLDRGFAALPGLAFRNLLVTD